MILDEAPAGLDVRSESEFSTALSTQTGTGMGNLAFLMISIWCGGDRVLCLNPLVLCQGIPEVALSPDNLSAAYGTEFVRYRHSH